MNKLKIIQNYQEKLIPIIPKTKWRAIGFATKKVVEDNLIKTETPFKNMTSEENKIINHVLDQWWLEESYLDDYDTIMLQSNADFSSAPAELDSRIENYKDDEEEVPKELREAFELFDSLCVDYNHLEELKENG